MVDSKESRQQSLYYRFAKLKAIREEEKRAKEIETVVVNESRASKYLEPWTSKEGTAMWLNQQYDYTRQYAAEYSAESDTQQESQDNNSSCYEVTSDKENSEDRPILQSGILARLNSYRGRRKFDSNSSSSRLSDNLAPSAQAQPPSLPPPSTCADFERTSTIMPPTELQAGEFESNVDIDEIKRLYFSRYQSNTSLPIYHQRKQIINSINSYSVVIIEGVTGCGKTTQVPMYILEDAILNKTSQRSPVIYVTQPRRIAARSIADRICNEHDWDLGSLVGYQVSLEKVVGPQTVLVFCTAGVLLQKIIQEKSLKNYTHIIIDEAHERDADTDLLMMMIRKLMLQEMSLFRLIVMSATMDIEKLKRYFTFKTKYGHQSLITPSHIRATDMRAPTNLQVFYLDKLKQAFEVDEEIPAFDIDEPDLKDGCLNAAVELIINVIPRMDNFSEESKSTLVFLPGLAEIFKLDRKLRENPKTDDSLDIFPLHSCLTVIDQLKIFKPSRPGCRKVILATNIAESSITLTDVGFIVDFCLTKTLMKDNLTRFPTLKLLWATNDKCTQRAGRTGRCCAGKVFRMVPIKFYQNFRQYAEPELLTAPLELSALRVKNFGMGDIEALLAVVLDPPPYKEIRTAVLELKQIGALSATYKGQLSDIDGDLTELGRIISILPIDVRLSKLIVIASVFDVLEDAIVVAACLSTNRTVVRYLYEYDGFQTESYETQLDWSKGTESDLFVSLNCYKAFKSLKEDRGKGDRWLAAWCNKNFLDERKLQDVDAMVTEIEDRLKNVNILTSLERPNLDRDANMDYLMLKLAFCAAFYPNYFLTEKLDAQRIQKELGGLDPTKTVAMCNLPINQVPLYKNQLTKRFENSVCHNVDYIADCSRALIVLKDEDKLCSEGPDRIAEALDEGTYKILEQSREIPKAMYMALKMADNIGIETIEIREYKERVALERMEYYNEQRDIVKQQLAPRLAPTKMLLVDDRPADNSRLIEATDEQYVAIMDSEYYIEVEFNQAQAIADEHELAELEAEEAISTNDLNHEVFESKYRRVRGPLSPIRMSFRSVLVKSQGFSVEIDRQSVNTILLDPEYEKDRRQMLVAASVTQSLKGKVVARDTTLMPNIRGLPSLMTLLFAQYYRLIYNDKMQCIAGGIFGIGWDSCDEPIDRDYEVILGFDIHITPDDIALINRARQMISELLKFTEIANVGKPQATMQDDLRKVILALIRRRRLPLQELDVSMIYYQNGDVEDDNLFIKDIHNLPSDIIEEGQTRPFLPLAEYTRQHDELALYSRVRDNLDHLKRIEDDDESIPRGGIRCLICGNGQTHCYVLCGSLFKHLQSIDHLAKVREFEWFERRALEQQQASANC